MKRITASTIDQKTRDKIVHEWKTRKLNSIPDIANEFKMSKNIVNTIINDYLSPKNKKL
ncbi:hypothetical protein [Flavobacterium johnsoniae]|uniref:Uncharacterized protein n=1 Tax=Flavobacterium johnsoniae TaxID=986 RepID=A0A1M5IJD8_FLAJO|nr:hypothetical protein [Flavobacterium johnsoniae]SHG28169.1 hypothetical protein SAMN05444388_102120 [Flavobacterium johnsoniae]